MKKLNDLDLKILRRLTTNARVPLRDVAEVPRRPQEARLQHLHLCRCKAGERFALQGGYGEAQGDPRDHRVPLHHWPIHPDGQALCCG